MSGNQTSLLKCQYADCTGSRCLCVCVCRADISGSTLNLLREEAAGEQDSASSGAPSDVMSDVDAENDDDDDDDEF